MLTTELNTQEQYGIPYYMRDTVSNNGPTKDAINPDYYKTSKLEAIEVMEAFSSQEGFKGYLKLTALKYILRLGKKDNEIQEISKAIWYLEKLKATITKQGIPNG